MCVYSCVNARDFSTSFTQNIFVQQEKNYKLTSNFQFCHYHFYKSNEERGLIYLFAT